MKKHFVSNSQESVRMFRYNWMEALSKVPFTVPLCIYVPVVLFLSWLALVTEQLSVPAFLDCVALGLAFWTLTEYVLHHFVFHYEPQTRWGQRLHFIFHGVHHDYPNDAKPLRPASPWLRCCTCFFRWSCLEEPCLLFLPLFWWVIFFTTSRITPCTILILKIPFG